MKLSVSDCLCYSYFVFSKRGVATKSRDRKYDYMGKLKKGLAVSEKKRRENGKGNVVLLE